MNISETGEQVRMIWRQIIAQTVASVRASNAEGLTPYQSGKELNHKERNDRAKLASKHQSFMAPRLRFFWDSSSEVT